VEGADALAPQHVVRESSLPLFQHFAHAADRREPGFQRGLKTQVHGVIGFAEILAALGVANDDMLYSEAQQHGRRNLSRVSAFRFPVNVLHSDGNVGALGAGERGVDAGIRRADDDFVTVVSLDEGQKVVEEVASFVGRFCSSSSWRRLLFSHEDFFSIL